MMRYMVGLLLLVSLLSCRRDEPAGEQYRADRPPPTGTTHLQVLLDPATRLDTVAQARWLAGLAKDLERMGAAGDRFQVCILPSGQRRARCIFKAESGVSRDYFDQQADLTDQQVEAEYQDALANFRRVCLLQTRKGLAEAAGATASRQSDLWSALELMSTFLSEAETGDRKQVHLLSSGRENKIGPGRRQLAEQPPSSPGEARAFAQTDAEWIRTQLAIDPQALANTTVTIRPLPDPSLQAYWEALLAQLGMEMDR